MKSPKKATQEQLDIVETSLRGNDMIIKAFAGTGKTSTLCLIANNLPHKRCVYLAFNKAIADEAKHKFPPSVVVKTTHALAYASVSKVISLKNVRGDYRAAELKTALGLLDFRLCQAVGIVFSNYCNSDEAEITSLFVEETAETSPELSNTLNLVFSPQEIANRRSTIRSFGF